MYVVVKAIAYMGFFMRQSQAHKIKDAYEVYKLDAQSRRVTEATLRTYDDRVKPFILWCESNDALHLQALTPILIRSYLLHLQNRQLSSYTVNGVARAIHAFLNFCVTEGLLGASPMRRVAIPKIDKKILPALSAVMPKNCLLLVPLNVMRRYSCFCLTLMFVLLS